MIDLETEVKILAGRIDAVMEIVTDRHREIVALEAMIHQLAMERRRVLLDENAGLEAALNIDPRTSDLRRQDRQSRKGSV